MLCPWGTNSNTMKLEVAYIALESEFDRIAFMESWLSKSGLNYRRFSGVLVPDPGSEKTYDQQRRLSRFGYDMTPSEIGCFLAHRECWRHCATSKESLLILESDVKPHESANIDDLWSGIKRCCKPCDIVRLHGIFEHNELLTRPLKELGGGYTLAQCIGDPMGAGAYIVSPLASRELLKSSTAFFQPVDVFLGSTWKHRLSFRTVKPYPFEAIDFGSVIGERTRPRQNWIQRLKIELRRFGDDLRRVLYIPIDFLR